MMRGVKKAEASMTTSAWRGKFKKKRKKRREFLEHVGRSRFDE
jgi:GTP cyclohydrolase I